MTRPFLSLLLSVKNKTLRFSVLSSLLLSACAGEPDITLISEQPVDSDNRATTLVQSRPGTFALRARVRYADIEALAAEQLPSVHPVADSRQICKRIMRIDACSTAQWELDVMRPGKLNVRGSDGIVYLQTPLEFVGKVGIKGRMARMLGLRELDVSGKAQAQIALSVQMGKNWCPFISADVSYQWNEKPTLVYQGRIDFGLENIVNKALDKQLAKVETRLNKAIDCAAFKTQLSEVWRSYSFPLELPEEDNENTVQKLHLNIVPTDFAFSGLRTEHDKLGVSFALSATTAVESQPLEESALELPPLRKVSFAESRTDFDLIIRADYTQLEQLLRPKVVDQEFTTESAAGRISVVVNSFTLSGNAQDVTVALGFTAKLPGRRKPVNGLVYLQATPVVNTLTEELVLDNIRLSRVLDSSLWELLSRLFEDQIIATLTRNSVLDLAPRLRELEQSLTEQLQDPERTAGVKVVASNMSISVQEIVAEQQALAARARVSTELDIDVPLTVIQKPLQRD